MNVMNVISEVSDFIEQHLIKYERLKTDTIYSIEYRTDLMNKERVLFQSGLDNKLNSLLYEVSQFRKDLELKKDRLERIYIPEDELLYFRRKDEYLKKMSYKNPRALLDEYERLSATGYNLERQQFIEDSGFQTLMSIDATDDALKLQSLISLEIRKRTDVLRPEYETLQKLESVERSAQRVLKNDSVNHFDDADLYVLYSISKGVIQSTKKLSPIKFKEMITEF